MPGRPALLRGKGPVGTQAGHGGHLSPAVEDGQHLPLEAGQLFLNHPFFYRLAQPSRGGEPVAGAPGPQAQGGNGLPVQPEVPGALGLAVVILLGAEDPPGAAVQHTGEGQGPRLQGDGAQPGDEQECLCG